MTIEIRSGIEKDDLLEALEEALVSDLVTTEEVLERVRAAAQVELDYELTCMGYTNAKITEFALDGDFFAEVKLKGKTAVAKVDIAGVTDIEILALELGRKLSEQSQEVKV